VVVVSDFGLYNLNAAIATAASFPYAYWKAPRETSMAAFRIDLLHRSDEHREQRHDLYASDIDAAVVQARALFRALSPGKPSLVSFRIMENGLLAYEASKGDLG
jgi:hypothetical protein